MGVRGKERVLLLSEELAESSVRVDLRTCHATSVTRLVADSCAKFRRPNVDLWVTVNHWQRGRLQ